MKKITVSIPDDVYGDARLHAAQRGTSVSFLVAEYLDRLGREELHERAVR